MSELKLHWAGVAAILAAALGAFAPMLHLEHGTLAVNHLIAPLIFAFWGTMLLTGRYDRKKVYPWLGISMIGWFYASRALLGEPLLDDSYSRLCGMCIAYLLALPFAGCMRDFSRKHGLFAVAVCYAAAMGILGWISVYASFVERIITIPYLNTHINMSDGRLWMNTHPNTSACMLLLGFMLGVWLITRFRNRLIHGAILLALAGMYLGIALTVSRTTMIQLSCFVGGGIALGVLRLHGKAKWKRVILAMLAALICAVLVFFSFSAAIDGINAMHAMAEEIEIVKHRDLTQDMYTLTGRTEIYKRAVQWLTTQPKVLMLGVLDTELGEAAYTNLQDYHAHNSYLQTAINYGLPALLIALALVFFALVIGLRLVLNDKASFGDQLLSGMLLVLLGGTITEPYLFTDNLTICNFIFMLVLGYVVETEHHLRILG